ncbi:MAG: hypothetical protein AVDCRST_MAG83-3221, partial [uncultured Arthrobacter sp.]
EDPNASFPPDLWHPVDPRGPAGSCRPARGDSNAYRLCTRRGRTGLSCRTHRSGAAAGHGRPGYRQHRRDLLDDRSPRGRAPNDQLPARLNRASGLASAPTPSDRRTAGRISSQKRPADNVRGI